MTTPRWILMLVLSGAACGGTPDSGLVGDGAPDAGPSDTAPSGASDAGEAGLCGPGAEGEACDDGDLCTTADRCRGGACVGDAVECADPSACEVASCDPTTGQCVTASAPDGRTCEDGDLCTVGDQCAGGACVVAGEPVTCDGTSTCVVGSCNPATGECEGEPAADGTPCENACVVANGRCRDGACRGTPRLCSPEACREPTGCNPRTGCEYADRPDGTACSDEDACTNQDACETGECVGRPLVCPEPGICQASICDPEVGCTFVNLPDGTVCDDGDECSFESECAAGACVATVTVECEVASCMASNDCNPSTGRCEPVYAAIGTPCDDANVCTEDEYCLCPFGNNCPQKVCGGGSEIPWTGTPCGDGICFTDVTTAAGITWTSLANPPHGHSAGAIMADLDGDDWMDIVLASESRDLTLYLNDGAGGFTDETASSGFSVVNTSTEAWQALTSGDYDDDGDLDIYVSFNGANFLLQNDGSAHFTDVTAVSGTQDTRWSTGAAFGDMDGDGDLDLVVGNYVAKQGSFFPNHIAKPNSVFRNDGNGTFTDVAATLNVGGAGSVAPGASLVQAFTDFDGDGDIDLLECNDFGQTVEPNRLYENDGTGQFTEVGQALGADVELFCMGIAIGDYDRDLDLDYYMTSIGHHAFLSGGASGFTDVASATGTRLENDDCFTQLMQAGWGTILEDLDNDGWQDLFVANGFIPADASIFNPEAQENKVLKNRGSGLPFLDISQSAGVTNPADARGLAAGDYDRDGDVDVLVVNMTGAPELYRNDSPNPGRHLVLTLQGQISNHFAPNTRVVAEIDGVSHLREYGVRPGYASSSPTEIYFGAGAALEADVITFDWPSGIHSEVRAVPTDARHIFVEPVATLEGFGVSGAFAAGAQLTATATITNHSASSQTVDVDVELWDADHRALSSERVASVVLGAGSDGLVSIVVDVPATLPSGPLQWVASVSDAGGGLDQDAAPP